MASVHPDTSVGIPGKEFTIGKLQKKYLILRDMKDNSENLSLICNDDIRHTMRLGFIMECVIHVR